MCIIPAAPSTRIELNEKEKGICNIITNYVCRKCKSLPDYVVGWCYRHRERCHTAYEEQAQEIYKEYIKPYEDDLK